MSQLLYAVCILFFSLIVTGEKLGYQQIVFVVLSQNDPVHEEKALAIEEDIREQTINMSTIYVTHRDLNHPGDWTVIPLLELLWNLTRGKFMWLFFCTDLTKVNVTKLISVFQEYDSQETFIGRALKDAEPTIIHHFAVIPEFQYPLFASGFGLNFKLVERLIISVDKNMFQRVDFSIDASHELAKFLKNTLNGTLSHDHRFCLENGVDCATYVVRNNFCEAVDVKKIYFAVKTCEKFHKDRIPIVKATWARKSYHLGFFSNVFDKYIPTIKLNVKNTETGHCAKTEAIFAKVKEYLIENHALEWVFLSDDDTILSVYMVRKLVGCYSSDKPYIIGERYGYNVYNNYGYNYITGGGGAVLSRNAVMKLAEKDCLCPSESTPDDMYLLGICAHKLNITLIHEPVFHQARPSDYSNEYLKIGQPISFHKHWMTDPMKIYKDWFDSQDLWLDNSAHSEL